MDFTADYTNVFDRKGAVYPYTRAATLGYGYGERRNDDLPDGVCAQIAENCGGWWSQLKTVNDYEGGSLSRRSGQGGTGLQGTTAQNTVR